MGTRISVTSAGKGAFFDVEDLIKHIASTGRDYIIQGQQKLSLADHTKPKSLDIWLRKQFQNKQDIKLADKDVMRDLVNTGYFIELEDMRCPDSGRMCKGLKLTTSGLALGNALRTR